MELLDRYLPLFVVGRGGMGSIEVAVERQTGTSGGRVVALKRMLPSVRDRRHVDMFLREARLATLLNHDNVVHAFAFGEQNDELFIAMEYVEGETLASLLATLGAREERIPLHIAAHILALVCDGLHAAHELRDVSGSALGVVHRDVCPHNVMLSYDGDVKLLDFGVAKLDNAAHLTKTGEVKGKTAYMSPEQAMGEPLDRRSDLYGVGATLFEVAAGRRMWTGETDVELIRQLALVEPPKLADVVPGTPRALGELQARLVAKKPKDRPETAREVAKALGAFSTESSRTDLVALLDTLYGEHKRAKQKQLEAAIERSHVREPEPSFPGGLGVEATRGARFPPWLYAVLGAAVASAAVFGLVRNRPATQQTTSPVSPTATVSSAVTERVVPFQSSTATTTASPPKPATTGLRVRQPTQPTRTATTASTAAPPRPPIDVDPQAI